MPYLYLVSLVIIAQLPNFPSLVRSSSAPLSATLPGVSQSVPASLVCCHVRQRSAAEALSTSEPTCSAGTPSGSPAAPFKAAPAPPGVTLVPTVAGPSAQAAPWVARATPATVSAPAMSLVRTVAPRRWFPWVSTRRPRRDTSAAVGLPTSVLGMSGGSPDPQVINQQSGRLTRGIAVSACCGVKQDDHGLTR